MARLSPSPCPLLELFLLCFPPQMQIYLYNSDDFDSLGAAIKERRIISAMAVFFEVGRRPVCRSDSSLQGAAPSLLRFMLSVGAVTRWGR